MKGSVYYWANARQESGERLFSKSSAFTVDEALSTVKAWESGHRITEAWIDSTDGRRILLKKDWKVDRVQARPLECTGIRPERKWMVWMIGRGTGGEKIYFTDYDRALKHAFAAKEDWALVYVYERISGGWKKCFRV